MVTSRSWSRRLPRRLTCLLLLAALSWATPARAQDDTIISSSITTAGADCTTTSNCVGFSVTGVASVTIYLNVGASGTFQHEASVDATSNTTGTWFAVAEDVSAATNSTADGALYFTNPGYRRFRLRASVIDGAAPIVAYKGTAGLRSATTISGVATAANQTTMITSLQLIDNIVSGAGANISQINGVAPLMGNGITGTGSPRVTIASDNTAFTVNAAQSGTWTVTGAGGTFPVTGTVTANAGTGTFVVGDGVGALNVIVDSSALPTGAAAEATLAGVLTSTNFAAAFGTSGAADTQVMSVQGIASMTPIQVQSNSFNLSVADDADFTDAVSGVLGVGAVAESALPTTVTEGDWGALAMTLNRALKVTLFNTSGTELTSTEVVEDAAETAGVTGPMILGVRRDTAASSAGATGDNATLNTDASGLLWTRFIDPCSGMAKTYIPIDITTAATTELTAALAGASNYYYICAINLITTAANNVSLVDDDTDNCISVTSGLAGGLTAAEGWNIAANGGIAMGNGNGSIMRTGGTNRVLCLVTSAATQLSGHLVVAAAP